MNEILGMAICSQVSRWPFLLLISRLLAGERSMVMHLAPSSETSLSAYSGMKIKWYHYLGSFSLVKCTQATTSEVHIAIAAATNSGEPR